MPQVPYQPYSTVSPSRQAIPYRSESVPAGAFGENVAQAQVGLGTAQAGFGAVLEKAGDEIMKRGLAMQELANETESKEAETKYVIEAGKMRADYSALSGKAAVDAYPLYQQNLKEARERIRGELSNDGARRKYDGPSMNTMSYTIYNGAGHAAQENRKWAVGAATSRVELNGMEAANNPRDDIIFQRATVSTAQNVKQVGDLEGWSDDKIKKTALQASSDLWTKRIMGMARDEPFKAQDMMEAAKARGDLQGDDIEKADKAVKQQIYAVGSRTIAQEVADSDPERKMTLAERVAAGEDRAKKLMAEDPIFKDYVRQRIDADWNRDQRIKRDEDYRSRQTVEGALMGGKDGPPTTIEELKADPDAAASWDKLDKSVQRRYLGVLAKNAKGDLSWDEDRLRRFQELKGVAATDPVKFLDTDVVAEDLPWSARQQLVGMQFKMKEKAEGDPRVARALQILGPDLNSAGVKKSTDDRQYFRYVGALQDALSDFTKENKRAPKAEEVQTIGRRLLQEQATGRPGWVGSMTFGVINTQEKKRTFEHSAPEQDKKEIEERLRAKAPGIEPTPEIIDRIYVREQFRKFYGGSPSVAKPTGDPTEPKVPTNK